MQAARRGETVWRPGTALDPEYEGFSGRARDATIYCWRRRGYIHVRLIDIGRSDDATPRDDRWTTADTDRMFLEYPHKEKKMEIPRRRENAVWKQIRAWLVLNGPATYDQICGGLNVNLNTVRGAFRYHREEFDVDHMEEQVKWWKVRGT
jgi:hypothetical protein